jgi:hypothetical protein
MGENLQPGDTTGTLFRVEGSESSVETERISRTWPDEEVERSVQCRLRELGVSVSCNPSYLGAQDWGELRFKVSPGK